MKSENKTKLAITAGVLLCVIGVVCIIMTYNDGDQTTTEFVTSAHDYSMKVSKHDCVKYLDGESKERVYPGQRAYSTYEFYPECAVNGNHIYFTTDEAKNLLSKFKQEVNYGKGWSDTSITDIDFTRQGKFRFSAVIGEGSVDHVIVLTDIITEATIAYPEYAIWSGVAGSVQDTFTRADNASGLGTAENGITWGAPDGAGWTVNNSRAYTSSDNGQMGATLTFNQTVNATNGSIDWTMEWINISGPNYSDNNRFIFNDGATNKIYFIGFAACGSGDFCYRGSGAWKDFVPAFSPNASQSYNFSIRNISADGWNFFIDDVQRLYCGDDSCWWDGESAPGDIDNLLFRGDKNEMAFDSLCINGACPEAADLNCTPQWELNVSTNDSYVYRQNGTFAFNITPTCDNVCTGQQNTSVQCSGEVWPTGLSNTTNPAGLYVVGDDNMTRTANNGTVAASLIYNITVGVSAPEQNNTLNASADITYTTDNVYVYNDLWLLTGTCRLTTEDGSLVTTGNVTLINQSNNEFIEMSDCGAGGVWSLGADNGTYDLYGRWDNATTNSLAVSVTIP